MFFDILQIILFSILFSMLNLLSVFLDVLIFINNQIENYSLNELQNSKVDVMFTTMINGVVLGLSILSMFMIIFLYFYLNININQFIILFEEKLFIKAKLNTGCKTITSEFLLEILMLTPVCFAVSILLSNVISQKITFGIIAMFPVEEYFNNSRNFLNDNTAFFIFLYLFSAFLILKYGNILRKLIR